ncbi:unnamed protein product [Danaus chrysippus]|uniref:(African queen) hypothetical protein n=1 Tax=Danaus chrysippus TaxID=151541 RepID=A0A8J2VZT0_9NEOP|nr:unnamed protein product [Danaus chrysippus]
MVIGAASEEPEPINPAAVWPAAVGAVLQPRLRPPPLPAAPLHRRRARAALQCVAALRHERIHRHRRLPQHQKSDTVLCYTLCKLTIFKQILIACFSGKY